MTVVLVVDEVDNVDEEVDSYNDDEEDSMTTVAAAKGTVLLRCTTDGWC
jgi:hypothetical protein